MAKCHHIWSHCTHLIKGHLSKSLSLAYTCDVGLAISLSDAISIEDFLSPQITITSESDNYVVFLCLCKYHLNGE